LVSLGRVSLSPPLLINKKPKETEREGKKEAKKKSEKNTPSRIALRERKRRYVD